MTNAARPHAARSPWFTPFRLVVVVMLLLAGTLINVGAAWSAARWGERMYVRADAEGRHAGRLPPAIAEYLIEQRFSWSADEHSVRVSTTRGWTSSVVEYSSREDNQPFRSDKSHTRRQFGVPFRALEYSEQSYFNLAAFPESNVWRVPGIEGGWPIEETARDEFYYSITAEHTYPLIPLPLGFIANTLLYAAALAPLLLLTRRVRRAGRRNRGLCEFCAYPVGSGPVCSECGRAAILR